MIFDLFHTLVNPEEFLPDSHLRADRIAVSLGLDVPEFRSYWNASTPDRIRSRVPSVTERLVEYCREAKVPRHFSEVQNALDDACAPGDAALTHPSLAVTGTLAALRHGGIRIGLLSNCDERESRAWVDSPLSRMVDAAGLSCDTGHLKPDREAYLDVLARLGGRDPLRTVYVGDGEHQELRGAREAGIAITVLMRGYVAGTGYRSSADLLSLAQDADLIIDSLPELLPHVGLSSGGAEGILSSPPDAGPIGSP